MKAFGAEALHDSYTSHTAARISRLRNASLHVTTRQGVVGFSATRSRCSRIDVNPLGVAWVSIYVSSSQQAASLSNPNAWWSRRSDHRIISALQCITTLEQDARSCKNVHTARRIDGVPTVATRNNLPGHPNSRRLNMSQRDAKSNTPASQRRHHVSRSMLQYPCIATLNRIFADV